MSLAKVKAIASKVRKQAVKKTDDPSLDCKCAICSYWIFKLCKEKGLDVQFALGEGHAFIIYKKNLVDVTAGQFGKRCGVIVKPIDSIDKKEDNFWAVQKSFRSLRGVKRELRTWPDDQTPDGFDIWDLKAEECFGI